ncbi:MAG: Rieske 2Fe-2S domain-containing protein [Lautropia sp.]
MLSAEENDFLTRVGPGTPMGNLMRQYWIPACQSAELVADAPPMRLMLLCEKLIAFRDTQGRVGIMDHRCPHRCASLFFGRNEEGGIRCAYHGLKFDVTGRCLETPHIPANRAIHTQIRAQAYPAAERNGIVYVYMGPRSDPPPLPTLEALLLPKEAIGEVWCTQRESNWLQALEGDIDTAHFGFLHLGKVEPADVDPASMHRYAVENRAPEYQVAETPGGTMYCAYRDASPGHRYYRFTHFLFPFWTLFPDGDFKDNVVATAWVPMDDTHTMAFGMYFTKRTPPLRRRKDGQPIPGLETDAGWQRTPYLPATTDWFGRWRYAANASNDYLIDREEQRSRSFSGIKSVPLQDMAMSEGMGPIVDRTREHLLASDAMIVRTRRRMLAVARALANEGTAPPWVDTPSIGLGVRSGSFIADSRLSWREAYEQALRSAESPAGELRVGA